MRTRMSTLASLLVLSVGPGCGTAAQTDDASVDPRTDGAPRVDDSSVTLGDGSLVTGGDGSAPSPRDGGAGPDAGTGCVPDVDRAPGAFGAEFYVSPTGADTSDGSAQSPFGTLERARTAVRARIATGLPSGGIAVWLRAGTYERTESFELGAMDSGTAQSPVVWSAYPCERVRLVGSKRLERSWFEPVSASVPGSNRLDPAAQSTVLSVDLRARGVTDFGQLLPRGFGRNNVAALELSIDGAIAPLARWPDEDQNDPAADPLGASVRLYGTTTPDVTGTYMRTGTNDGVSVFERVGLVQGKQYRLYRRSAMNAGVPYTAWFVTTSPAGAYPSNTDPFWSYYQAGFGAMNPSNGAVGKVVFRDPAGFNHGFSSMVGDGTVTRFTASTDRLRRWTAAPDGWIHGYFVHMWADDNLAIASIDAAARTITVRDMPYGGQPTQDGQPWFAFNLLEELTRPGEWYLDRTSGRLFVWPTSGFDTADLRVSMLAGPLVRFNGASHVELVGLELESTRSNLVTVTNGAAVVLSRLLLSNAGTTAVRINGGTDHRVSRCTIRHSGEEGVDLSGGNRAMLARGGHVVEDCEFEDFARFAYTYHPAVRFSGVGHTVRHNRIHGSRHSGILFGGNEHLVELNEVYDVCAATSDAGAIYTGRDWGARGNVIRHNFVHDIRTIFDGFGVHGIYLDDAVSGIRVEGNVLYRVQDHAIQHGGGRDDILVNNVVARSGDVLAPDTRAQAWWKDGRTGWPQGELLRGLQMLNYRSEPWASRYPACAAIPNDWAVITANDGDPWLYPQGSVFSRNVGFGNERFITDRRPLTWFAESTNNLEDSDPRFVDEATLDLTLRPDSPALAIPGFVPIPFSAIGLRASAMPPR